MLYTNADMLKVVEVIDNIEKTNGTNDKIGILRKNGNNELLKKVLFYTYNSDLQFGVKKTTINKFKYSRQGQSKWMNLFGMLDELARSNINKDLTREVELFLQDEEEFKDLYIRILLKDMRIGLNVKNINKAIPNLIPTFEIMLGSKGEIDRLPNEEMYVTEKFDGVRCFTQIRNGQVIMKSRQNKVFEGLVDIVKDIKALGLDNVCLDGELLAIDVGNEDVYKETMKRVSIKDMEKHGVKYMLFDVLPLLEFDKKIGLVKYSDRRRKLESISETEFIKIAPLLYRGKEVNEILTILDEYRNKGSEGLMINVDKPYEFKRSKTLLKLKVMSTVDLRVIGLEEGDGRLAGTLGNIIVEYKGNTVKVGSGFSLRQRDEIWNSPCDYLNKIVEIQYFEETTNEQGTLSLRFPIFKQWRFDKDEPSYE